MADQLFNKLYLLTQIIQDVCDVNDIKAVAPSLTKTQFQLLKILDVGGAKTVSELAEIFNISRPAISKTVDKLAKQHLIDRTEVENDRRSVTIALTILGERILVNYNGHRSQRLSQIYENFTEEEIALFDRMIDKFIDKCVDFQDNMELVCLQCDGTFNDNCKLKDRSDSCYYRLREINHS